MDVYNTLTRRKEPFEPLDPARVTMYACGPTVYDYAHIGNARPAVVFDLLFRVLRNRYPDVVYARNFTDIDDKINAAAQVEGVNIGVISARFMQAYHEDMSALQVLEPSVEPRATDHLSRMVEMIRILISKGHAYEAEGHVLFHVPSYSDYGQLSRQKREEQIDGARVEVAPYKKDAVDFVLWKPSPPELPGWESPWGRGRPGWHIECSSMVKAHLGETIDIHAGGSDLVFPHHENEIAQSVCAHDGVPFARYWMHNAYLNIGRRKMAKSLGNSLLVKDLLAQAPGEAIRLALLSAHYRSPLDWSDEALDQAARRLDRLYGTLRHLNDIAPEESSEPPPALVAALEDDLNTPVALSELAAAAHRANRARSGAERAEARAALERAGLLLGVLQHDPDEWFVKRFGDGVDVERINRLVAERHRARMNRDFEHGDRIRDELDGLGIALEDGPEGSTWRPARKTLEAVGHE